MNIKFIIIILCMAFQIKASETKPGTNDSPSLEPVNLIKQFECKAPSADKKGAFFISASQIIGAALDFVEDHKDMEPEALKAAVKVALCSHSIGDKSHLAFETIFEYASDHKIPQKTLTKGLSSSDKKIFDSIWKNLIASEKSGNG